MTDLVIFVGIVGLVVVLGILVGMIVAGRLDRILERSPGPPPRPATTPGIQEAGDDAGPATPHQEEQP